MKNVRKILFPFSILYDFITSLRNRMYDKGILKSTSFDLPIICVGNLSVGGTGKTPMVEYLIRLLSDTYSVATLSRGYKRKSEGFFLANEATVMEDIGDEPFQYHSKFKNISVAVDAKRVEGVQQILERKPNTQVIVLDDALQHRKIKAGFYIMLTSYDELYYKDYLLPAGNLRESRNGVNRADVVVVTKCPSNLSNEEMQSIRNSIRSVHVYFSTIAYDENITNGSQKISLKYLKEDFIAIAGIAKPTFFFDYLKINPENTLTFPDHHHFSESDIQTVLNKANGRKIITTEKDYVRLKNSLPQDQLFYLPIEMKWMVASESFDDLIENYVKSNN